MPELAAYLFFDGNCAEAMRFYERSLGGKIDAMVTQAESPAGAQASPGSANRIMHASMSVHGGHLMASDWIANEPYPGQHGVSLSLHYPTVAEGRRIFDALGEGGQVTMPFDKTFWAEGFGMLVDRFGTPWTVNAGQLIES